MWVQVWASELFFIKHIILLKKDTVLWECYYRWIKGNPELINKFEAIIPFLEPLLKESITGSLKLSAFSIVSDIIDLD